MVTKNGIEFTTPQEAETWARNAFTGKDRFAIVLRVGGRYFGRIVVRELYSQFIGDADLVASYRDHESYR